MLTFRSKTPLATHTGCNVYSEMGGYKRAVSGQRLGRHVPAATDTKATTKEMFSIWSVPRCFKQGTRFELSQLSVDSSVM
jgi:hypothetical protein